MRERNTQVKKESQTVSSLQMVFSDVVKKMIANEHISATTVVQLHSVYGTGILNSFHEGKEE